MDLGVFVRVFLMWMTHFEQANCKEKCVVERINFAHLLLSSFSCYVFIKVCQIPVKVEGFKVD